MSGVSLSDGTVLVVGADGLVGSALAESFGACGSVVVASRRKGSMLLPLDLAKDPATWELPQQVSVAFLCGAVTSLQMCREKPMESRQINVTNTVALAQRLRALGARVVFFSSGLVFDGTKPFQSEADTVNPQCEYGRQKAETECMLLAMGKSVAIVRLTKVVAPELPLFWRWAEDLRAGRVVRPFSDYVMSPITLGLVAEAMRRLALNWSGGVWHVGADAQVSYTEAASRLATRLGACADLVQPTTSREAGVDLETVPMHTTLGTTRLQTELGLAPPPALAVLDECFASL